jgi:hypothetical protein
LGGFRCARCHSVGADLDEMGFDDEGYVPSMRRMYSRDQREFTRTDRWDSGPLGW